MMQMDPTLLVDLQYFIDLSKATNAHGMGSKLAERSIQEIKRLTHNYEELKKSYDRQTQRYNLIMETKT